jgi:stage V sporulation protein G
LAVEVEKLRCLQLSPAVDVISYCSGRNGVGLSHISKDVFCRERRFSCFWGVFMQLTEVRIKLCQVSEGELVAPQGSRQTSSGRLRAYCTLTFDDTFVIRDVKLIEGHEGLFLAMPSRKLSDHCPRCGEKNHLRARYCNQCGQRLDENRHQRQTNGNGAARFKLHADIAHPINAQCRQWIEQQVIVAFQRELERSRQPDYVPPNLDGEDSGLSIDSRGVGPEFRAYHIA